MFSHKYQLIHSHVSYVTLMNEHRCRELIVTSILRLGIRNKTFHDLLPGIDNIRTIVFAGPVNSEGKCVKFLILIYIVSCK